MSKLPCVSDATHHASHAQWPRQTQVSLRFSYFSLADEQASRRERRGVPCHAPLVPFLSSRPLRKLTTCPGNVHKYSNM